MASQAKNEIVKRNDGDIYDCAYDNIRVCLNFSFCPKMKSHNSVLNITNESLQIMEDKQGPFLYSVQPLYVLKTNDGTCKGQVFLVYSSKNLTPSLSTRFLKCLGKLLKYLENICS